MKKGILLHEADDDVGVTAMDLKTGEVVQAVTLEGEPVTEIKLVEDVPLSHKVAMRNMDVDEILSLPTMKVGSICYLTLSVLPCWCGQVVTQRFQMLIG